MLNIKLKSHVFVKQYGESPRTPPLEGTSLHQRNSSVETLEDLEPVYDYM